ncbi:light-harvesting complex protein [Aureococcus anophagefferens]|nr:light-harvesting complex protein [Aureococcus anophagefferens]
MQKLIIASSIATASAFVAPTSTASASTLKAQESMEGPTVDPWSSSTWLNKALDAPNLLSDGRSPSVLNGGGAPHPFALAFTAIMAGLLDIRAIDIKERTGYDKWIPGDYGFDPSTSSRARGGDGRAIVALSEGLFTPIIYMPWFQHVMDTARHLAFRV